MEPTNKAKYLEMVIAAEKEFDIPNGYIQRMIGTESAWNDDPNLTSSKGAQGIAQFMPETARAYTAKVGAKYEDRNKPEVAFRMAGKYLRDLADMFNKDTDQFNKDHSWMLAIASYNYGRENVLKKLKKFGSSIESLQHLPDETVKYLDKVFYGGRGQIASTGEYQQTAQKKTL